MSDDDPIVDSLSVDSPAYTAYFDQVQTVLRDVSDYEVHQYQMTALHAAHMLVMDISKYLVKTSAPGTLDRELAMSVAALGTMLNLPKVIGHVMELRLRDRTENFQELQDNFYENNNYEEKITEILLLVEHVEKTAVRVNKAQEQGND